MIRGIVLGTGVGAHAGKRGPTKCSADPDTHFLKEPAVRPQDVIAACMQQSVLPDLEPHLQVEELQVLAEVPEDIHQPKLHQEAGNFLAMGSWYLK